MTNSKKLLIKGQDFKKVLSAMLATPPPPSSKKAKSKRKARK
jgi:hypothetical protein